MIRAALGLLAALEGAAWQQTGLEPIRYDDCGASGRQPHVTNGGVWTFPESEVAGPLAARTVAFEARSLRLRYESLDPGARYGVRLTYVTERTNPRTQRLQAEGQTVHGDLPLPQGEPRQFEFALPEGVAADGAIELACELATGHNAAVAEVWLLSDEAQPRLSLGLSSDLRGTLAVEALDGLQAPVAGARAEVTWPGGAADSGATDAEGRVRFRVPERAERHGEARVRVQWAELTQEATLPLTSIVFARPTLTPIPDEVASVADPSLSLSGTWRFSATPPEGFERSDFDDRAWSRIAVPGEWVMQGRTVEPGTPAGYRRTFRAPADWRGGRTKLRFDGVYSRCEVWLNGTRLGGHEGGFTPFELDATDALRPGQRNVLALSVISESTADALASASSYARHPLGGITRKVTAFRVPPTHLTRLRVRADAVDPGGELTVRGELQGGTARLRVRLPELGLTAESRRSVVRLRAPRARHWDAEHPNLYTLEVEVLAGGEVVERVRERIGFRTVMVQGNRLLVNGQPVKLHGVCRHEVHPQRGRSLTPAIWRRDVELLKGCNVNLVRTAHYPPAEEFIALCDEAGIYVQEEGPYCWVGSGNESSAATLGLMLQQHAEMIERDHNHPSVILWDIANESAWGVNFARMTEYAHAEDPSRPTLFSGAAVGAVERPEQRPALDDWHYPGPTGPDRVAQSDRPVTFGEYCHLNCYNVAEVEADPGLRDYWGRALQPMWDAMYASPGCLGGTIWCWADDVFELPGQGRVGYGEWGVIDGYQRPKPEWWHVRKSYSPVRIPASQIEPGDPITLPIENRFNHTNLSEVACQWRIGERRGMIVVDLALRTAGALAIPAAAGEGDVLRLWFGDPSGRTIDEYALPVVVDRTQPASPAPETAPCPRPELVLTEQGTGRDLAASGKAELTEEQGTWRYRFVHEGPEVLVREIGLVWRLGPECTRLTWERDGQWSVYPRGHIGRLKGTAWATPREGVDAWGLLTDPRGCNDFRSTKYSIQRATLTDAAGAGIEVLSGGRHAVRASVEAGGVALRVLDFANGGGEGFLRGHYAKDDRLLRAGDVVEGEVTCRPITTYTR